MNAATLLADDVELVDVFPSTTNAYRLPERFEIVYGNVTETTSMSDYAWGVADRLQNAIKSHLNVYDVGVCSMERLFRIPQPDDPTRSRRPDVFFLSYDRSPATKPLPYRGAVRDVVPDLAVEVVSPNDTADDLIAKVREYLAGGVLLVWVIYPLAQEIHTYLPNEKSIRVYFADDDLDAGPVLNGFSTRVGDLFPPMEEAVSPASD